MEVVTAAVHEIDRQCPTALLLKRAGKRAGGEEGNGGFNCGDDVAALTGAAAIEIEVDVDALDPWTFYAVERVVAPVAALRRASTMRRTKKKRPALAAAAGAAASSSSGKSSSKAAAGCRHYHQPEEGGGAGASAATGGEGAGKGDRGKDGGAAAGAGPRVGGTDGRPNKKAKVVTGASSTNL